MAASYRIPAVNWKCWSRKGTPTQKGPPSESKLRTSGLLKVELQVVTDTHKKLASDDTFKDGPFLPADMMDWMIDMFLPKMKDRETALASPLSFLSSDILFKISADNCLPPSCRPPSW